MKKNRIKYKFRPWMFVLYIGLSALIGCVLFLTLHLNFWIAFVIALFAIAMNGWIATGEDNALGGFNNPKPDQKGEKK